MELVDTLDLGSSAARCAGSIPVIRTTSRGEIFGFLIMASAYIIYSKILDRFYTGSCLDFEERLRLHNSGHYSRSYTSKADDWSVHVLTSDLEYEQARSIERHIKNMKSRKYILNLAKYSEMVDKLIFKYRTNL